LTGLAYHPEFGSMDRNGDLVAPIATKAPTASSLVARARLQENEPDVKSELSPRRICACGNDSGKLKICVDCQRKSYDEFHKPATFLERVQAIRDEREGQYGPPTEHWAKTVAMLNALGFSRDGQALTIADWPEIMVVDKLARGLQGVADNRFDVAGYVDGLHEVEYLALSRSPADTPSLPDSLQKARALARRREESTSS
jgi:hypothetical protein